VNYAWGFSLSKRNTFNARAVIAQAENGELTLSEVRKQIRTADDFGQRDAASALKAIEQRMSGERATRRLSNAHAKGTAAWAYAELGAVPKTAFSWAALDREGRVVINLWDDPPGWAQDSDGRWHPVGRYGARGNEERDRALENRALHTRTEFFKLLEVAVASQGGLVRAILSTAEDITAIPRKRAYGLSRPWLNEDDSPVVISIGDLDLANYSFTYALADDAKRPRSPFTEDSGPRLGSRVEDRMLREYSQSHPGRYYLEVTVGERRVDAVRIAAPYTAFFRGSDLRLDAEAKDGAAIEAIEVKQGTLRRNIIDQAIGSANALRATPVAIVEIAPADLLQDVRARYPTFKVWPSRRVD
jgi:hypothetical protein